MLILKLTCSTQKLIYFILEKGRRSRNEQNIQDLFIYFVSDETKTTLKPCAMPSLNLPVKSIYSSSTVTKPREWAFKITEKKNEAVTPTIPTACYKSYEEFVKRVLNFKLSSEWNIQQNNNIVYVTKLDAQHMAPLYETFIRQSLRFQIRVLG